MTVLPGDAEALAEAISDLAQDPELRVSLGEKARILVEQEFNLEHNADRLAEFFRNTYREWKSPRENGLSGS